MDETQASAMRSDREISMGPHASLFLRNRVKQALGQLVQVTRVL
jgi:hypothetical protein